MKSIDLRFSYLNDWVGSGNYELNVPSRDEQAFAILYRAFGGEFTQIGAADASLSVWLSAGMNHGRHAASISDDAYILVSPKAPLTSTEIVDRYMRLIQNLITFATDAPNAVDEVVLVGTRAGEPSVDRSNRFYLFSHPIFPLEKTEKLGADDLLFSFADCQGGRSQHLPEVVRVSPSSLMHSARSISPTVLCATEIYR